MSWAFPAITTFSYSFINWKSLPSSLVPFFRQPNLKRLCRAVHFTSALHIKVTGFEPMALCTQNRCADQTALHLVSPPSAYRSTRSMNTRTELAHPFGHRDARTNPSNQPLFLENLPPARQDRATPKSRIVQERSHFFFSSSFTWIKENPARLPVLWTQSPLRSGFEPLTQGFSVLCSNQLSYLNHFPKVCFLHRIAPYLTYHLTSQGKALY